MTYTQSVLSKLHLLNLPAHVAITACDITRVSLCGHSVNCGLHRSSSYSKVPRGLPAIHQHGYSIQPIEPNHFPLLIPSLCNSKSLFQYGELKKLKTKFSSFEKNIGLQLLLWQFQLAKPIRCEAKKLLRSLLDLASVGLELWKCL